MPSIHYTRILKRVTNRVWDTLSEQEKAIIVADTEGKSAIGKWFASTVKQETQAKYESATYWMNDPSSFKYSVRSE